MTVTIDAMGKTCPVPVFLAKKAMDDGARDITISVDNEIAVQNLTRLAASQGMTAQATPADEGFAVRITGDGDTSDAPDLACSIPTPPSGNCVYLIEKDHIGDGDETLGKNLMKMFLYTLTQSDGASPHMLIFMNGGVWLPAGEEEQIIQSLQDLEEKGCEIIVCGTCLNFFGLGSKLKVGAVSNMYEITERLRIAEKVITL